MKNDSSITGVILSAGLGSRIKPLSFDTPKPLLPVMNRPIMEYQMEAMRELGIREVIVVVGHLKEKIMDHFGDGSRLGLRVRYIEQKSALGIAHAVGALEGHLDGPFLLFLGDIFTIFKDLESVVRRFSEKKPSGVLVVKRESDPEFIKRNFAIALNPDGTVKRVIEKPRYTLNDLKGCGIYLFDLPVFDAIRRTPRTALRDEYEITNSIQIMIEDGHTLEIADAVAWDMNVTVPEDLLECNLRLLEWTVTPRMIGRDVNLARGTEVVNSVIGDGVCITRPITIRDSLILPGVNISDGGDIEKRVVSGCAAGLEEKGFGDAAG